MIFKSRRDFKITAWTSYTPTWSGSSGGSPVRGTDYNEQAFWRIVGNDMEITYNYYHNDNTGTANPSGNLVIELPSGYIFDSSRMGSSTNQSTIGPSFVSIYTFLYTHSQATAFADVTNNGVYLRCFDSTNAGLVGSSANFQITTQQVAISYSVKFPYKRS